MGQDRSPEQTDDRLAIAVESSPAGVLMVDADGFIVLVNAEVERLFGYAREELLGESISVLVPEAVRDQHPRYREAFMANLQRRAMGVGRELHGRRKDGSLVPVEVGLTPVTTSSGTFVLSSIVDVTERRKADARTRAILESIPCGMLMIDTRGRIVLVNQEVERLFGYPREELLGSSVDLLVPERFRRDHPEFRASYFKRPSTRPMGGGRELFGLRKDGSEFPIEIGLNPFETPDGLYVLSSVVDISARKEAEKERQSLEAQLRQAQKMEALGTLAGGVAHDFNNILSTLIGYAEFLGERLQDDPDGSEDVEQLKLAAERGRQLVARILLFSRNQKEQLQPTDLRAVAHEVGAMLKATLPPSIDLRISAKPAELRALANPTSVHQVLVNLVTNAVHAMPNGGPIEVQLAPCYVRDSFVRAHPELTEGHHIRLRVKDKGSGISSDQLERIFEPFFTTKAPGAGTGLGLTMVHKIMSQHGGTVVVESQVGRGTSFDCYFPALDQSVDTALAEVSGVPQGQGQRVLCVDDEPTLLAVLERRLTSLGYVATVTTDPRVAAEWLEQKEQPFDLLLTDYSMPHLTGLQLARTANRTRPGLPILVSTGFTQALPESELQSLTHTQVLGKPLNKDDLASALAQALHGPEPSS